MKKNRKYLKPYIRRARQKDFNGKKLNDIWLCAEMAFYEDLPKCYVLVQHGSHKIVGVGASKDELKNRILEIRSKKRGINKRYNKWENKVKKYAQEH